MGTEKKISDYRKLSHFKVIFDSYCFLCEYVYLAKIHNYKPYY